MREPSPWVIATIVMLAMIMGIIDSSIVNVAIPHMMGTFGASVAGISWVVTGYILANVVIIPLSAWLASLLGRSRLYFASVVIFTLASAACGVAPNLPFLVATRIVQGLAAGVMMPTGQAILYETFPPERRGSAMAFFGLGVIVGPALGPTLGGWIVDNYGWPWIFYINLPIGILSMLLVSLYLHDPPYLKRRTSARGDLLGVLLLTAGIGTLQYVLEKGEDAGWFDANWVVIATLAAVVVLVAFVAVELEHPDPAVDLRVFKDGNFRTVSLVTVAQGVGFMGGMFMLPMFLQSLVGYSATQSGFVLLPGALASAAVAPLIGRLSNRGDTRLLAGFGLLMFMASMFLMSRLDADATRRALLLPQILRGIGMGFCMMPLMVTALATIPKERTGQATGLFNLSRQLGGSLGIAWLSNLFARYRAVHVNDLVGYVDPVSWIPRSQVQGIAGALAAHGLVPSEATTTALLSTWGRIMKSASELAFRDMFFTIALLFAATVPLLFFVKRVDPARPG